MPTVVVFKDETTFMAERVLGVYSAHDPDDDKLYFVAQVNGNLRRLQHEIVQNVYQLAPPENEATKPPEVATSVRQLELFPVMRGLLLSPLRVPTGPYFPDVAPHHVDSTRDPHHPEHVPEHVPEPV